MISVTPSLSRVTPAGRRLDAASAIAPPSSGRRRGLRRPAGGLADVDESQRGSSPSSSATSSNTSALILSTQTVTSTAVRRRLEARDLGPQNAGGGHRGQPLRTLGIERHGVLAGAEDHFRGVPAMVPSSRGRQVVAQSVARLQRPTGTVLRCPHTIDRQRSEPPRSVAGSRSRCHDRIGVMLVAETGAGHCLAGRLAAGSLGWAGNWRGSVANVSRWTARRLQPARTSTCRRFRRRRAARIKDAVEHAVSIADEAGAGTLVQVGRFDLVELAVVLEPDEPLAGARRVVYAVMNAMGDALAALLPAGKAGRVRLAGHDPRRRRHHRRRAAGVAGHSGERYRAADWLVGGMSLRVALPLSGGAVNPYDVSARGHQPGDRRLREDGQPRTDRQLLPLSAAAFDGWREAGFEAAGRAFSRSPAARKARHRASPTMAICWSAAWPARGDRPPSLVGGACRAALARPETGEPWL